MATIQGNAMKRILLAGLGLFAFAAAQPALAADRPLPYKAPPPAPIFNWTKCYVGVHGGYGWGRDRNGFSDAIASGGSEGGEGFPAEFASFNHTTNGGVFGGQLGCNYQAANNWVVGVEGELWWSGIKGSHTNPEDFTDPGSYSRFASRNRWDGDVALRLGYAQDRSLLYGKAGVAFGNFRYTETHDDFPTDNSCGPLLGIPMTNCQRVFTNTRAALLLGVGWEYAFTNYWTFKVEYNYIAFGSDTLPYPAASAAMQSFPVRDTKQVVKVGVNYLFGGPY
jgi:outer membrane immunogenic protein